MAKRGVCFHFAFVGILTGVLLAGSTVAKADIVHLADAEAAAALIRDNTSKGLLTGPQEVAKIEAIWKEYYKDHPPLQGFFAVGQPFIDGTYPVTTLAPGTTATLTFGFVDTVTGQLTTGGPTIGSVEYLVNTDPSNPNLFTLIGTSTDATSDFALGYMLGMNEPDVRGIPFDPSGNPIVLADIGGSGNVAMGDSYNILSSVPEPSSIVMVSISLVCGLLAYSRYRAPCRAPRWC
jgi:hypothetical protein